jgi:hypothetical protein
VSIRGSGVLQDDDGCAVRNEQDSAYTTSSWVELNGSVALSCGAQSTVVLIVLWQLILTKAVFVFLYPAMLDTHVPQCMIGFPPLWIVGYLTHIGITANNQPIWGHNTIRNE